MFLITNGSKLKLERYKHLIDLARLSREFSQESSHTLYFSMPAVIGLAGAY